MTSDYKPAGKMSTGIRILIVDDEERILQTYSLLLEDLGYYVRTASQPEDALRLVTEDKFDLAFIDQFLGSTTGLQLIEEMTKIDPELYYVIITANASADLAVASLKKGASDFISKPFLGDVGDIAFKKPGDIQY